jgi:hypothetical protein
MKNNKQKNTGVVVYQAKSGAIELRGDFGKETIWANQKQIADIFNIERSVATKHISNILKIKEVDQKSNVQKMHIANSDKPVVYYSLDVILAVGYRTNSYRAIQFRQWATKTLRQYITHGFAINKKRIAEHYSEFQKVVEDMKNLFPPGATIDSDSVLELISAFADTWFSLDAYDKDALVTTGATKKSVSLTAKQLAGALLEFKQELIRKKQATDIFGQERSVDSIGGIVGNVMQSFGGKDMYATVEEKAAHLLYFMVKNHPFVDGNKRSGAYAFVWFLRRAKILDTKKITPPTLTALTLFVAESDPKHKDRMIRLVLQMLK